MSSEIVIRPAKAEDIKFVMSSWKRSWRECPWAGTIPNNLYFDVIRSTIEGLLGRGAVLTVACTPGHQDAILGWACMEVLQDGSKCCHFLYVKDPYLRMGIGEKLVLEAPGALPGLYTHRFRQVVESCPGFRHAPEIARRK